MTYSKRNHFPEIELWNVSLLPTVKVASPAPPQGPAPLGGVALKRPALLSVAEVPTPSLARAA